MKFQVALLLVCFVAYISAEEFVCKPDVKYRQNKCNNCVCLKDNKLGCTRMICKDPEGLANCTIGTTSKDEGGNDCWCVKDFGTICVNP